MTPQALCPACIAKLRHTPEDWKNHPYAGHGYQSGQGWSHPDLEEESKANSLSPACCSKEEPCVSGEKE